MRLCAAVVRVRLALTLGLLAVAAPILWTQAVFRSGVDLVSVIVTVTDRNGRFVPDLKQGDFTVLDDGKPQEIVSFDARRVPVSLGIVLDVSGTMTSDKLEAAGSAINRFLDHLLDKNDEVFLSAFAVKPFLLLPWTHDPDTLRRALNSRRRWCGPADCGEGRQRQEGPARRLRWRRHEQRDATSQVAGDDSLERGAGVRTGDRGWVREDHIRHAARQDGASHAIKVEVRKRRVIVRMRSGYVASAHLGPKRDAR
jgi:hypothetical protein